MKNSALRIGMLIAVDMLNRRNDDNLRLPVIGEVTGYTVHYTDPAGLKRESSHEYIEAATTEQENRFYRDSFLIGRQRDRPLAGAAGCGIDRLAVALNTQIAEERRETKVAADMAWDARADAMERSGEVASEGMPKAEAERPVTDAPMPTFSDSAIVKVEWDGGTNTSSVAIRSEHGLPMKPGNYVLIPTL